jgi:hypothetical protein
MMPLALPHRLEYGQYVKIKGGLGVPSNFKYAEKAFSISAVWNVEVF